MKTGKALIFVMGSGRSGTSAVTKVLSLCGYRLPRNLMPATSYNQKGYFESYDVLSINDSIIGSVGGEWSDPLFWQDFQNALEYNAPSYIDQICCYLDTLSPRFRYVIKDPRLSIVSQMWHRAAVSRGWDVRYVIPFRRPDEAVHSYMKYTQQTRCHAAAIWLRLNRLAERNTRQCPRAFVYYDNLLHDWRSEVQQMRRSLNIRINPKEIEIDKFLDPSLRNENQSIRNFQATYYSHRLDEMFEDLMRLHCKSIADLAESEFNSGYLVM